MKLQDMSKEELLEIFELLAELECLSFDNIPFRREDIIGRDYVDGGEEIWQKCQKYRQPLIDYAYLDLR